MAPTSSIIWSVRTPSSGIKSRWPRRIHELSPCNQWPFQWVGGTSWTSYTEEGHLLAQVPDPDIRIAISRRYIATGDSCKSLQHGCRVAHSTISKIIPETCHAITLEMCDEVMQCRSTPGEWKEIAEKFSKRWNFHNSVGAIDGKYLAMRCPLKARSVYYNYKGFHSIVLLAIIDADYEFLFVDVGANGTFADTAIFEECGLYEALEQRTASLPEAEPLPNDDHHPMPYALVEDDAFGLRTWLMKLYPIRCMTKEQRIFNYRLSWARRVVENAFVHRFRCLLTTIQQHPHRVERIVMSCCLMHNLLAIRYPRQYAQMMDMEDPHTHEVLPGMVADL